jgi:diadenosine tetraphosphate (Ap4A) HIT family hydrolase
MFAQLWNGWRAAYVRGESEPIPGEATDSIFVRLLASGASDEELHIIHRGSTCFVILNAFPYATGHLMVIPYRQVAELEDLTAEEQAELWRLVTEGVRALKLAYRPEGINIGANLGRPAGGSVSDHIHIHVVPRWTGDSNFMTAIANTRTLPEALVETASRLRAAWPGG